MSEKEIKLSSFYTRSRGKQSQLRRLQASVPPSFLSLELCFVLCYYFCSAIIIFVVCFVFLLRRFSFFLKCLRYLTKRRRKKRRRNVPTICGASCSARVFCCRNASEFNSSWQNFRVALPPFHRLSQRRRFLLTLLPLLFFLPSPAKLLLLPWFLSRHRHDSCIA